MRGWPRAHQFGEQKISHPALPPVAAVIVFKTNTRVLDREGAGQFLVPWSSFWQAGCRPAIRRGLSESASDIPGQSTAFRYLGGMPESRIIMRRADVSDTSGTAFRVRSPRPLNQGYRCVQALAYVWQPFRLAVKGTDPSWGVLRPEPRGRFKMCLPLRTDLVLGSARTKAQTAGRNRSRPRPCPRLELKLDGKRRAPYFQLGTDLIAGRPARRSRREIYRLFCCPGADDMTSL